jgi:anti-sigma B factor antagonist
MTEVFPCGRDLVNFLSGGVIGIEVRMALLPGALSKAGPLSSASWGLEVAEYGPDALVVTVVGEIDALSAPELAAFLTVRLVIAPAVVVNLDGARFMESAGLSALFEAKELASREDRVLRLVCNSQIANWALDATGLREQFTFADSVPDAVKNSS